MTTTFGLLGLCLAAGLAAGLVAGERALADQVLYDFEGGFDPAKIGTTDAAVSAIPAGTGAALRIRTGRDKPWPGITLPAPDGRWDLSTFGQVALDLKNPGQDRVTVHCRVDNPGADGRDHCVTGSLALAPGQSGTLRVPLKRTGDSRLDGKLFGMRGYPVSPGGAGTVDPKNIIQLVVFVNQPVAPQEFELDNIRATGSYTPPTASVADADPYFPCIDTFGQYKHKDWPGKVRSLAELQERRQEEARQLAAEPARQEWCRYGGWAAGPQLEATGFFRTEKYRDKWWLVDPDGHLFWSHGVDCVRMLDTTPVEEREHWFEAFPGREPDFREFMSSGYTLKGHYAGRNPQCFSFAAANIKRKYGSGWKQAYAETAHLRLRSWGLNTIANWSDEGVRLMRRTPYTDTIGSRRAKMIEGSEGYWGKFPDVFDSSFAESLRQGMAGKANTSAGDPWCIGFFSDNEIAWGDELSLALAALQSPPDQAAKRAFLADLQAKYTDIAKLNQAWGTTHPSWDALRDSRDLPDRKRARADLTAFYTRIAEQYFRTVREVIQAVAPRQLYLGCRFAWVNDRAAQAAAPHCDVVSYNLYRRSVADFHYPGGDKPLIVGEFHFGALDRGMFHTGLVPVENQTARAKAYFEYVLGALRHSQFVGTHWFQWKDEPTTGRVLDEENYQIGLLDVADTPYAETIAACRQIGRDMYQTRLENK